MKLKVFEGWKRENKEAKPISHIDKVLFSFIFSCTFEIVVFVFSIISIQATFIVTTKKVQKQKMSSCSNGRLYFFVINTKNIYLKAPVRTCFLLYIEQLLTKYEAYIQVNLLIGYKIQQLNNKNVYAYNYRVMYVIVVKRI